MQRRAAGNRIVIAAPVALEHQKTSQKNNPFAETRKTH
jgi:hypothetical protein